MGPMVVNLYIYIYQMAYFQQHRTKMATQGANPSGSNRTRVYKIYIWLFFIFFFTDVTFTDDSLQHLANNEELFSKLTKLRESKAQQPPGRTPPQPGQSLAPATQPRTTSQKDPLQTAAVSASPGREEGAFSLLHIIHTNLNHYTTV